MESSKRVHRPAYGLGATFSKCQETKKGVQMYNIAFISVCRLVLLSLPTIDIRKLMAQSLIDHVGLLTIFLTAERRTRTRGQFALPPKYITLLKVDVSYLVNVSNDTCVVQYKT